VNYSLWYPAHASLKPDDPEAGSIEGELIRITLDALNRPMIAEAVYACGCYHRIYPAAGLERAAAHRFGKPLVDTFALAAPQPWKIDPIIPELAGSFDLFDPHPRVWVRSGFHLIAAVTFEGDAPTAVADAPYELRPSTDLERLPFGTRIASFFGPDGLVRGADRPEASLLYASGIYHAGTPRIRGARKIHFDQYDYDDPTLLETLLRLPDHEILRQAGMLGDGPDLADADRDGRVRDPL
jgi:hypothetical protein